MTAATYDAAMVRVYADEGGFGIDAHDPGGATTFGVTIIDANLYAAEFGWIVGRRVTVADMRVMPKWFAAKVYKEKYAKPMHYDDLPAGVDYGVLDAAINSGVGRAPKWLAAALKLPAQSIAALVKPANDNPDKVGLIQRQWSARLNFLHALGTWQYFGKGWGRRVAEGEAASVKMWLKFGAALPDSETKKRLDAEAGKAKTQASTANKAGTASAGTAAGPLAPVVANAHLSTEAWVLIAILGITAAMLAFYFIRNAIIHKQRAAAYAAA